MTWRGAEMRLLDCENGRAMLYQPLTLIVLVVAHCRFLDCVGGREAAESEIGVGLSRRRLDPWRDLARLRLARDWTRPSLERNPIANCWRVQCNNAGAAKEQYRAGVVVRLDDTASCFRAV
jgi:hypothetical protein